MATIHIDNLKASILIGTGHCERQEKQDVVLQLSFIYDATKAEGSDKLEDAIDYEALSTKVINRVAESKFFLLEKLGSFILNIIMEDRRITSATVKIDKPNALEEKGAVSIILSHAR